MHKQNTTVRSQEKEPKEESKNFLDKFLDIGKNSLCIMVCSCCEDREYVEE